MKTLVISYIGIQTQEVAIKSSLKVVMKSDTEMLDEVMVVAFGTAKSLHLRVRLRWLVPKSWSSPSDECY